MKTHTFTINDLNGFSRYIKEFWEAKEFNRKKEILEATDMILSDSLWPMIDDFFLGKIPTNRQFEILTEIALSKNSNPVFLTRKEVRESEQFLKYQAK